MQKNSRQIIASAREKVLMIASERLTSSNNTIRAVEIRRSRGSSLETVSLLTLMGRMIAAIPMRSKTLMILLPMTLPTKISVLPLRSDEKDTASSGAPVPKATIVRPTSSLLTLKFEATEEAPSTSQSAPLIRKMKPTTRSVICKTISIFYFDYVYSIYNSIKLFCRQWIMDGVVRMKRL